MIVYPRIPIQAAIPLNSGQRDNRWIMSWERVSFLELGPYETAPGTARWHARNVLRDWGLERHEELAKLVLSELVTNSVLAGRSRPAVELPPVRLWLLSDSSRLLLLVWDALAGTPRPREAGPDDESGRGLFLVRELSTSWGCYRPPGGYAPDHGGGKVTWALIGTEPISAPRCRCGYQSDDDTDFLDHLQEVFIPLDGITQGGQLHDEGQLRLACLCGFQAATACDLDRHFIAVFTTAGHIGLDGHEHAAN